MWAHLAPILSNWCSFILDPFFSLSSLGEGYIGGLCKRPIHWINETDIDNSMIKNRWSEAQVLTDSL